MILVARGKHNNGYGEAGMAQVPAQVETAAVGKHDVKQNYIDISLPESFDHRSYLAQLFAIDCFAVQMVAHCRSDVVIVLYNKYPAHILYLLPSVEFMSIIVQEQCL